MDSSFLTLNDMPLMAKSDLVARLRSHVVPGRGKNTGPRTCLTLRDIARWCACSIGSLYAVSARGRPCSDLMQVRLTQFYSLLDSGRIEFVIDGKTRAIVRGDRRQPPILPPLKKQRAHIDFTAGGPKMSFS